MPVTRNMELAKEVYWAPEVLFLGWATDTILERAESRSKLAAKRIRQLIDESGGSLSYSPARECQAFQVNLSLVSKQFKRLYRTTIRAYSRRIRMMTAEKLLRESNHLNIDEAARALGYSFTSAFSRCFQKTFGKRPKRYQMQRAASAQQQIVDESITNPDALLQI
jgi:AraC-like DNA-binding protein